MAINDVYELTLTGAMQGQSLSNVFFYEQRLEYATTESNPSETICNVFYDQILPAIAGVAGADLVYNDLRCRNLFDTADNFERVFTVPGTLSSAGAESLPSYAALGYKLETGDTILRPGSKRFAGVLESGNFDGVVTGTLLAPAETLRAALDDYLLVGTIIQDPVFAPIIVKRIPEDQGGGVITYRLPTTLAEAVTRRVLTVLTNLVLTTQVSRKEANVL